MLEQAKLLENQYVLMLETEGCHYLYLTDEETEIQGKKKNKVPFPSCPIHRKLGKDVEDRHQTPQGQGPF